MEWLKKLSEAINYIEANLDQEISYEEAARIACCSTFYFQRIFSYVSGISLAEYIRRRRMTQAAFELQRTDARVMDIALKYGYHSPTSFNRAFQSVHGMTPTAARRMGCTLNAYPAMHFSVQVTGGDAMTYHIAQKPALRLVGVRIPLVESMEENQRIIPGFWESVLKGQEFSKICGLSAPSSQKIFGVSVYEGPHKIFYYIAAASDAPVPPGMFGLRVPAAAWAVFENEGRFKEDVQTVFQRFYREWLPFSGYKYAGLPDMEVYPILKGAPAPENSGPSCCGEAPAGIDVTCDMTCGSGHSEVWIAIKKEERS